MNFSLRFFVEYVCSNFDSLGQQCSACNLKYCHAKSVALGERLHCPLGTKIYVCMFHTVSILSSLPAAGYGTSS